MPPSDNVQPPPLQQQIAAACIPLVKLRFAHRHARVAEVLVLILYQHWPVLTLPVPTTMCQFSLYALILLPFCAFVAVALIVLVRFDRASATFTNESVKHTSSLATSEAGRRSSTLIHKAGWQEVHLACSAFGLRAATAACRGRSFALLLCCCRRFHLFRQLVDVTVQIQVLVFTLPNA